MTTKRFLIYARASSGRQDDIDRQIDDCRRAILGRDGVVAEIVFDRSAAPPSDRAGISLLLGSAANVADAVMCSGLDRISRDLGHLRAFTDELDIRGLELLVASSRPKSIRSL